MTEKDWGNEANMRRQVFKQMLTELNSRLRTPLSIVVCGSKPPENAKTGSVGTREKVRSFLAEMGDQAFFLEDWINSTEGMEYRQVFEMETGHKPSLQELEMGILQQSQIDKNIHILESPGSIAELADFNSSPEICRKSKIFIDAKHKNQASYILDVVRRVTQKGGKTFWYTNPEDLLENVRDALKPNRIEKANHGKTL